ncbi:hypothetical protein [Mesorhizobium sp. B1-1-7]|uniref:hypothetical protein n=1 Tax=Mesorhizobium sp. B1-1-7 TaxID=2589977 RepID=UPI00112BA3DA|nr:hypothetical protein [Mesorhizobium sp. B1-1-7]TPN53985.1 hypothetical protein FJ978_07735 [Mesorhizobium sp. B1-1-7]
MLIFSRRTLQTAIDTVSGHMPDPQLRSLVRDIEKPNKNGIPGVWELYLLAGHILAHKVEIEPTLANGKKPDLLLSEHLIYTDIKSISDDQAHRDYPVGFFMECLSDQILRRLPVKGDYSVVFGSRKETIDGHLVSVPALPPKADVAQITKKIALDLRLKGGDFKHPFEHSVVFDEVPTKISFEPGRHDRPTLAWNSAHFTTHRRHDREVDSVAKSALDGARPQLEAAPEGSLRGVYLCDGGTELWTKGAAHKTYPIHDIVRRYIASSSWLDFVVVLSVEQDRDPPDWMARSLRSRRATYKVSHSVIARDEAPRDKVDRLVQEALAKLDPPLQNIESAYANRMKTAKSIGFRGGWTSMGEDKFRIPARSLGEILAGGNARSILDGDDDRPGISERLAQCHRDGRMIVKTELVSGRPGDDDWVDITFGPRDAAAGPFQLPNKTVSSDVD